MDQEGNIVPVTKQRKIYLRLAYIKDRNRKRAHEKDLKAMSAASAMPSAQGDFEVFGMDSLGPNSFDTQAQDIQFQEFMAEHYPESVVESRIGLDDHLAAENFDKLSEHHDKEDSVKEQDVGDVVRRRI